MVPTTKLYVHGERLAPSYIPVGLSQAATAERNDAIDLALLLQCEETCGSMSRWLPFLDSSFSVSVSHVSDAKYANSVGFLANY